MSRRTPRKKSYVNSRNKKKRIAFANKYLSKDNTFWDRVLWSNESKFNLFGSDGRIKVWRKVSEELNKYCLHSTIKHSGGSVFVWGFISCSEAGNVVLIEEVMDIIKIVLNYYIYKQFCQILYVSLQAFNY